MTEDLCKTLCGGRRNNYSKTDHDATFMRLKRDYMGNDQLHRLITCRWLYAMNI